MFANATPQSRATGHQQPDLVAVPDRSDGVHHDPAVGVVAADEGQQHADAEVEALQHEVAGPERGDQQESDVGECHGGSPQ